MRTAAALAIVWLATAGLTQQAGRDVESTRPSGSGAIAGTVYVGATDAEPARRARVMLNATGDARILGRTTTTDDAGRFLFRDVPAARYTLQAAKPGFLPASYGARRPGRPGTPIPVAEGQRLTGLMLRLVRGGVVAGTARDSRGRPVAGVPVLVLRLGYGAVAGERTLSLESSAGSATTDDRGAYRAWGLPPGDYVVMASPQLSGGRGGPAADFQPLTTGDVARLLAAARGRTAGPNNPPPTAPRVNYAPVFFPGTPDVSQATTIALKEGEERTGVDVPIGLFRTARIKGTVRMTDGGALPTIVPVTLAPAGPQADLLGVRAGPLRTSRVDRDGKVAFHDVPPGRYRVLANTATPMARGAPPPTGPSLWAMAEVTVDGGDVTVELALQPAMTASGRVVFEGAGPPPANVAAVRLVLVPPGSGGNLSAGPAGGQIADNGTFRFTNLLPGSYRLLHLGSYSGWTVRSAEVNGRDYVDAWLPVEPGESLDLTVTFTDRVTEIAGVIEDAAGRPVPEPTILVFPAARSQWVPGTIRIRGVRPGTDGHYRAVGLPPGDYLLVALADVEPGEWNDPRFLESLAPAAIRLSLTEGEKKRQDLRITPGGGSPQDPA